MLAWQLPTNYRISYRYGSEHSDEKVEELVELMRENIDQALLRDNNLGKAYEALAEYYIYSEDEVDERVEKSLSAYKKAVELSPNDSFAHYGYFTSLRWKDFREYRKVQLSTFQVLEEAYELDPLNPVVAQAYANYLIDIKQEFEKGLAIMDKVIENYPDFMPIKVDKSWVMRDMPYGRPDEAFKYMYEAHLDDPKNNSYMAALIETSLDVDFLPFAEYMLKQIEENSTEENRLFRTYNSKRIILTHKGDFEGLEKLAEERIQEILSRNEDAKKEDFIGVFPPIYYQQGRFEEVIDIAKIRANEIFEPNFVLADSNEFYVKFYASILLKNRDKEKASIYADAFCSSLPEDIKGLDDYSDISEFYVDKYTCDAISGNFEKAVEGIQNIYFDLNSRANWPNLFNSDPTYSILKDYEPFMELKQRMFEDLHGMRANIIEFLKAEGEWKEEWEEEN